MVQHHLGQSHNDGVACTNCHTHAGTGTAGDAFKDQPARTADTPHDTSPTFDDCLVCHVDGADPTVALPNSKCLGCHDGSSQRQRRMSHFTDRVYSAWIVTTRWTRRAAIPIHIRTTLLRPLREQTMIHGSPNFDGICETCHASTNHHQSDGTAPWRPEPQ